MGHTLIGAVGDHDVLDFDVIELSVSQPVTQSALRHPEASRKDPGSNTPRVPVDVDEKPETEDRAYGAHCRIAMQYLL
jgi:hypothetical protein